MRREHLGYEEDLVPSTGDRPPDQFLRLTRPIHLGAIDMRHAEIEATLERSDRAGKVRLLDIPGALADDCDLAAARPELSFFHKIQREPEELNALRCLSPSQKSAIRLPPGTTSAMAATGPSARTALTMHRFVAARQATAVAILAPRFDQSEVTLTLQFAGAVDVR
jgi:hypothetical protein